LTNFMGLVLKIIILDCRRAFRLVSLVMLTWHLQDCTWRTWVISGRGEQNLLFSPKSSFCRLIHFVSWWFLSQEVSSSQKCERWDWHDVQLRSWGDYSSKTHWYSCNNLVV
jgi:hypothetical protein